MSQNQDGVLLHRATNHASHRAVTWATVSAVNTASAVEVTMNSTVTKTAKGQTFSKLKSYKLYVN